jgi:hypothetical protein
MLPPASYGFRSKGNPMRIMMLVCSDARPDTDTEKPGDIEAWCEDVDSRGKRILGDRLRPVATAKTVRVRGGKRRVTDGPFAESKEVILGFDILECDSMEEAIDIAARHPMARAGCLELREFWPLE